MNKTLIKNFAIDARVRLIQMAIDNAGLVGIAKDKIDSPIQKGSDFEIYKTLAGTEHTITGSEIKQRENLVKRIKKDGFENVMEAAAYTKCRLTGAGVQASDHHEALITSIGRDGSFFKVNSLHLLTNRLSFGVDHGYKFIGYTALERTMGIIRKDAEHRKHQMAVEEQFSALQTVRNHGSGIQAAHFDEIGVILGMLVTVPDQGGIVSLHVPTVCHLCSLLF